MSGRNKVGVARSEDFDADGASQLSQDGGRGRSGVLGVFGAVLTLLSLGFILVTFPLTAWMCAKVVQEYERAVIFRLGRVVTGRAKGPGTEPPRSLYSMMIPELDPRAPPVHLIQRLDEWGFLFPDYLTVLVCKRCCVWNGNRRESKSHALDTGGLFWFIPWLDVIKTVDLRTVSFYIRPLEVLTADGVPLKVDAVVFYRVVDPSLWVTRVKDGDVATHTLAQTAVRATLGAHGLADVLTQTAGMTTRMEEHALSGAAHVGLGLQEVLHAASRRWGVQVERVELKGLTLPVNLQRCMAAEAEATRTARAKMILAEGEVKASCVLKEAALGLSPVALHLRYLQSLSAVDSGASIVVFSLPTELLHRLFSHQAELHRLFSHQAELHRLFSHQA
ncbi:stomatin [Aulostomus maculatus]